MKIMPVTKREKRLKKVNPSNKIDISMSDDRSDTALHAACRSDSYQAAQYLLICGADGSLASSDGDTPFSLVIEKGYASIVQLLLEKGEYYDKSFNEQQVTMLYSACRHGRASIAQHLLTRGTDPNAKSLYDRTPVHVASQNGHTTTLRLLLESGRHSAATKSGGYTPLHLSAQSGHLDVAKTLFDFNGKLDPAPLSESHATPLFLAASNGHVDVFDYLNERQPMATNKLLSSTFKQRIRK